MAVTEDTVFWDVSLCKQVWLFLRIHVLPCHVCQKHKYLFTSLHGVTSQKTVFLLRTLLVFFPIIEF